jgi:hypothetical protein
LENNNLSTFYNPKEEIMIEIKKLWFADEKLFVRTDTGEELWQSLLWYPRLRYATDEQRTRYEIDDEGIRWDALDEDVSLESFKYENPEPVGVAMLFRKFPELNVSAVARRLGMKQSLLASYISGIKKPSIERENEIFSTVHNIGRELMTA